MSKVNYWDSFVPAEAKEARFGLIPAGENHVHIICVKPIKASQNFKLDDSGQIIGLTTKEVFEAGFDQEVLAIVFQDEQGRVLIDRRSSIGWLKNTDPTATPAMIQKHSLVSTKDGRFTKGGIGVPSKERSASCVDMASRLFNACGVVKASGLLGAELKIIVKEKKNGEKTSNEVVAYYPATAVTKAAKPAADPIADPTDDDLPF